MPPTKAMGTVTRISDASTAEPSAMLSSTNTPNSAAAMAIVSARDARAWLSTRPAEIEEVAARQLQLRGQALADVGGGAAQIAAGHRRLDGDAAACRPRAGSRRGRTSG